MVYEEKEEGEVKKMKSSLRGANSLHSDEDEDETVADGVSAEKGEEGLGSQKPSNDVTKEFTLPNETESQKSSNGITLVNETREFGNQKHCEEDWKLDKFHVCCVDDEDDETSWGFDDLYGEGTLNLKLDLAMVLSFGKKNGSPLEGFFLQNFQIEAILLLK